jgi:hypothetical protein
MSDFNDVLTLFPGKLRVGDNIVHELKALLHIESPDRKVFNCDHTIEAFDFINKTHYYLMKVSRCEGTTRKYCFYLGR